MTIIHLILEICGILFLFILLISFAGHKADGFEIAATKTILENQLLIIQNQYKIMAQFEDFSAALDKVDADIQAVADKIGGNPDALTPDQAAAILGRIAGQGAKLEALVAPPAPPAA